MIIVANPEDNALPLIYGFLLWIGTEPFDNSHGCSPGLKSLLLGPPAGNRILPRGKAADKEEQVTWRRPESRHFFLPSVRADLAAYH